MLIEDDRLRAANSLKTVAKITEHLSRLGLFVEIFFFLRKMALLFKLNFNRSSRQIRMTFTLDLGIMICDLRLGHSPFQDSERRKYISQTHANLELNWWMLARRMACFLNKYKIDEIFKLVTLSYETSECSCGCLTA